MCVSRGGGVTTKELALFFAVVRGSESISDQSLKSNLRRQRRNKEYEPECDQPLSAEGQTGKV